MAAILSRSQCVKKREIFKLTNVTDHTSDNDRVHDLVDITESL